MRQQRLGIAAKFVVRNTVGIQNAWDANKLLCIPTYEVCTHAISDVCQCGCDKFVQKKKRKEKEKRKRKPVHNRCGTGGELASLPVLSPSDTRAEGRQLKALRQCLNLRAFGWTAVRPRDGGDVGRQLSGSQPCIGLLRCYQGLLQNRTHCFQQQETTMAGSS